MLRHVTALHVHCQFRAHTAVLPCPRLAATAVLAISGGGALAFIRRDVVRQNYVQKRLGEHVLYRVVRPTHHR